MASKSHKNILLLNGPNLNLLGTREPGIYGSDNLPAIEQRLIQQAKAGGATLEAFQSNSEADLVNRIQQAARDVRVRQRGAIPLLERWQARAAPIARHPSTTTCTSL